MKKKYKTCSLDEMALLILKGKLPKWTIDRGWNKIIKDYFKLKKNDASKCQLFVGFLKSHSLVVSRKIIIIRKVKSFETANHVVRNLQGPFNTIGKNIHFKYYNVSHHVLSKSIVNKTTRKCHLLTNTSHIFKLCTKMIWKYYIRRENLNPR